MALYPMNIVGGGGTAPLFPREYLYYGVSDVFGLDIGTYVPGQQVTCPKGFTSNAIINVSGINGNIAYSHSGSHSGYRYIIFGLKGNTATLIHNVTTTAGNDNFSNYDYLVISYSGAGSANSVLQFTITES